MLMKDDGDGEKWWVAMKMHHDGIKATRFL